MNGICPVILLSILVWPAGADQALAEPPSTSQSSIQSEWEPAPSEFGVPAPNIGQFDEELKQQHFRIPAPAKDDQGQLITVPKGQLPLIQLPNGLSILPVQIEPQPTRILVLPREIKRLEDSEKAKKSPQTNLKSMSPPLIIEERNGEYVRRDLSPKKKLEHESNADRGQGSK